MPQSHLEGLRHSFVKLAPLLYSRMFFKAIEKQWNKNRSRHIDAVPRAYK